MLKKTKRTPLQGAHKDQGYVINSTQVETGL